MEFGEAEKEFVEAYLLEINPILRIPATQIDFKELFRLDRPQLPSGIPQEIP